MHMQNIAINIIANIGTIFAIIIIKINDILIKFLQKNTIKQILIGNININISIICLFSIIKNQFKLKELIWATVKQK